MPANVNTAAPLIDLFARRLKAERERVGLTQRGLAEASGLRDSYVSMLERGQRVPPLDTLATLADALGVEPYTLLRAR